jgi:hypothetical protein
LVSGVAIAKPAGFLGTSGGVVAGVEIEHHPLALEGFEAVQIPLSIGQRKIGGRVANGKGHRSNQE